MQYVQHCILSTCAVLSQAWCAGNNHHEEVCIREGVLRAVSLCRCMHGAYYLLLLRVAIKRKQQHGRRLLCVAYIMRSACALYMRSGQQQACVLSPSVCMQYTEDGAEDGGTLRACSCTYYVSTWRGTAWRYSCSCSMQ